MLPFCTPFTISIHISWTMAKQYGKKKMNWYWEHLKEHIGNLMGTKWEQIGTTLGIVKKQNIPPPPKSQKKKKKVPFWPFHWFHGISISHLWPRLMLHWVNKQHSRWYHVPLNPFIYFQTHIFMCKNIKSQQIKQKEKNKSKNIHIWFKLQRQGHKREKKCYTSTLRRELKFLMNIKIKEQNEALGVWCCKI